MHPALLRYFQGKPDFCSMHWRHWRVCRLPVTGPLLWQCITHYYCWLRAVRTAAASTGISGAVSGTTQKSRESEHACGCKLGEFTVLVTRWRAVPDEQHHWPTFCTSNSLCPHTCECRRYLQACTEKLTWYLSLQTQVLTRTLRVVTHWSLISAILLGDKIVSVLLWMLTLIPDHFLMPDHSKILRLLQSFWGFSKPISEKRHCRQISNLSLLWLIAFWRH